uniref:Putative gk26737 rrna n=1 Tax=Anopheles darlingi TaxID=43151 RepID=A0A2M4CHQ7_ANODA
MMFYNWNELSINPSARIKWRASLVPAAAVIPAPLAYIKIVAVKTFEVDSCPTQAGPWRLVTQCGASGASGFRLRLTIQCAWAATLCPRVRLAVASGPQCPATCVYLEQIRVL